MAGVPLVFLDTETTALHPAAEAWEIAMIRREPDGSERTRCFYVDVPTAHADAHSLAVGGYYQRHPRAYRWPPEQAPKPGPRPEVLDQRAAAHQVAIWTQGAWIVGSNPAFDVGILGRLLRRQGITPAWDYHLVDVVPLAAGWVRAALLMQAQGEATPACGLSESEPPWASYALSRLVGVEPPGEGTAHTALYDALWVRDVYDAVMREYAKGGELKPAQTVVPVREGERFHRPPSEAQGRAS